MTQEVRGKPLQFMQGVATYRAFILLDSLTELNGHLLKELIHDIPKVN